MCVSLFGRGGKIQSLDLPKKDAYENKNVSNCGFNNVLCSHCMHVLNMQLKWPHVTENGGRKAACFRSQEFYTGIRRLSSFCQWLIGGPIYSWTGIWCNNSLFWHILQSGYAVFNASCYISSAHGLTPCNINFAKRNDITWHWLKRHTVFFQITYFLSMSAQFKNQAGRQKWSECAASKQHIYLE